MNLPRWHSQLRWSQACLIGQVDLGVVPPSAGLYAFTKDAERLTRENALYIGKADGAVQTIGTRLRVYQRTLASGRTVGAREHAGLRKLAEYHREHAGVLFVRWACVIVARELEGRLIEAYGPRMNGKEEHRSGYDDDTLIPGEYLFDPE